MPMTWNDQADAKLLIGIIKTAKPKIDYDALAVYMGGECTAYAIQHRMRKIQAKANEGGESTVTTPSKAPATPTKAKKPTTPRKTPAAKKTPKRKTATADTSTDIADIADIADEDDASPSKKVKSEDIKEEDVIKKYESDGDEA